MLPFVIALTVYSQTLAPGVYGFDSAELATGAYTLGIVHPPGYPLYLLLVRLAMVIPIGTIAFRANLVSALMGAATVGLSAWLGHHLTGRRWAGWMSAFSLAFALEFWRMSVVAEVYTLQTMLLACLLVGVHRFTHSGSRLWLLVAAGAYGLSLANHTSSVLYVPGLALALALAVPRSAWARVAATAIPVVVAGLLFYLYLPLRAATQPPLNYVENYYGIDLTTWSGLWWMVSGQAYWFFSSGYDAIAYAGEFTAMVASLLRNFTGLGVVLGIAGWISLIRSRSPVGFLAMWIFASTSLFVAGYAVSDKNTMYLPAYLAWSMAMAVGVVWAGERLKRLVLPGLLPGLLPRLVYTSAASMVIFGVAFTWRAVDLSRMDEPKDFAYRTFRAIEPRAVIVAHWSPAVILEYYQQVEGWRPDVEIFNRSRFEVAEYYREWSADTPHPQAMARILATESRTLRALAGDRPIYDIQYSPGLASAFEYRPVGNLFRLLPLQP